VNLKNISLSAKLLLLVGIFIAVFAAFAWFSWQTLHAVRVNGPLYQEIAQGKDLIADVLPPPAYIIETHLTTLQLASEKDSAERAALIERGTALRLEFENRHEFWKRKLTAGKLADAMNVTAYRPAAEYFEVRDRDLVPAVKAGEIEKAALALAVLGQKYEAHRRAVDEVVKLASLQNTELEKSAELAVHSGTTRLFWLGVFVVGVVIAMAVVTGRLATKLVARIDLAGEVASRIASGDLTAQVPALSDDDETARLLKAIKGMTESLNSLVTRVKQASIEMMSTATEFAATSREQEGTISGFGASTSAMAVAVKEISATSSELLATMEGVNAVAGQTAQLAQTGRAGLSNMRETMQQLERSTATISARLEAIREKTSDISGVVTTITKVADQTNLLSVNAAIEAEKAGENGLGFLVLAREIRRLADQTAVATLDIAQMVRHMQNAVAAGVMEMDRFAQEVRSVVARVEEVGGQLGQIIGQVTVLSERFDSVNHGMRSQAQGARQISEAMAQLNEGARQSTSSLKEFNAATSHLRDAVSSLKQEISHFRVAE
jgi:methyl-accepting chemotaxis protein WspA